MSKKGPFFCSNFGLVCRKSLSFSSDNRPFLSSCKRPLCGCSRSSSRPKSGDFNDSESVLQDFVFVLGAMLNS